MWTWQTYEGAEILNFQGYRIVRIIWDNEPIVFCQTARIRSKIQHKKLYEEVLNLELADEQEES